jgi:hypothetical protein
MTTIMPTMRMIVIGSAPRKMPVTNLVAQPQRIGSAGARRIRRADVGDAAAINERVEPPASV